MKLELKPHFLDCPETDVNLHGREGEAVTKNILSWDACSKICSETRNCQNWIWHHGNSGEWSNQCVTLTDYSSTKSDTNTISGRVGCREKKV